MEISCCGHLKTDQHSGGSSVKQPTLGKKWLKDKTKAISYIMSYHIRNFEMLSVDGDADAAVEARIRIVWNKFRQLVPLLTNKDVSLIMRGRLYSSCVRSSMLHGSETCPVRKENVVALQRAEMRMVRWMCDVKLKDRLPSKELRERLGVQGGPKNTGLYFRRDNFVVVSLRKACSVSKFSQFYREKRYKSRISMSLNILCQICSNHHNS